MSQIWNGLLDGMGWLLAFFYSIIPNAGVAIILLTIVVRLVLFPLTAKQAKSMIAMQRVQPEIKKLQAKYKNDRQKLNEELMKFYKENKINPLGGCLPLLAQLPIFFALFRVLRDVQKHIPTSSDMFREICSGASAAAQCKKPTLDFFGMDLAKAATQVKGMGDSWPYWILVVLVIGSAYIQQRQTQRFQTQANAQMQVIGKVMPLIFGFFSISFPAGLVLYFFVSNLWQIGQQELVYKTIGTPAGPPAGKAGRGTVVEAKAREVEPEADESPPAPAPSGGGLKGLFKAGGEAAPPARKGGTGSAGGKGAGTPKGGAGGGAKATGGAKGGQARGGSSQGAGQARRRSNRKRKR